MVWNFIHFQTLYTYPDNFRAYKALIAAQYSGVQVKIASDFEFGVSNKTDAFLKKFPTGQVNIKIIKWIERNLKKEKSEQNSMCDHFKKNFCRQLMTFHIS